MCAAWRNVSVYVCSNFSDMYAEREHLARAVFPALRDTLSRYRVQLVDVDPWWDGKAEYAENHRFLGHCLRQIDSARPFFIGLLGEAYGTGLREIPEAVVRKYDALRGHIGKSITELQIIHGALRPGARPPRALFYFRDPQALEGVPEGIRWAFYREKLPEQTARLDDLKERIRQAGLPVCESYLAQWDPEAFDRTRGDQGGLSGLQEFGKRVHDDLLLAIREELGLAGEPPAETEAQHQESERAHQLHFITPRARGFIGRADTFRYLLNFVEDKDETPCLVTGPVGSGKSSLLARLLSVHHKKYPEALALPHFVEASRESSSLYGMLRTFCLLLKSHLGFAEEIPTDTAQLATAFRSWMVRIPEDRPTLLLVDGLNQLDGAHRAHWLDWLPEELPPHVKAIVSVDSETRSSDEVLKAFHHRMYCSLELPALTDEDRTEVVRRHLTFSPLKLNVRQMNALLENPATGNPLFLGLALGELLVCNTSNEVDRRIAEFPKGREALNELFDSYFRRLERDYSAELVQKTVAYLAASRHGVTEKDLEGLLGDLASATDLHPLLRHLRPHLSYRGAVVHSQCRGFLDAAIARYAPTDYGRLERRKELADYLEKEGYSHGPTLCDLPWLRARSEDWEGIERILCDLSFIQAKCEAGMVPELIADYDVALSGWPGHEPTDPFETGGALGAGSWNRASFDVASQKHEAQWSTQASVMESLEAIPDEQRTIEEGEPSYDSETALPNDHFGPESGASELIKEMRRAETASVEGTDPHGQEGGASRTQAFARFVVDHHCELSATPEQTVLLARSHGSTGPVAQQAESLSDGFHHPWIARDPRPSPPASRTLRVRKLDEHTGAARAVAVAQDGRAAVSVSEDTTVRVWDLRSGRSSFMLQEHLGEVSCVALAREADLAVSGSDDRSLRVWDVGSGECTGTLEGHEGAVLCVDVTPDGAFAVSGSEDGSVRVWDIESGMIVQTVDDERCPVTAIAVTPDGRLVVSASREAGVHVWETESGRVLLNMKVTGGQVDCIALANQGRLAGLANEDGTVTLWELATGQLLRRLERHNGPVTGVALNYDGRLAVSCSFDSSIRVWNVSTGQTIRDIPAHDEPVNGVALAPDGRLAVSACADGSLALWDLGAGIASGALRDTWSRTPVALAPDERVAVAVSPDHSLRFWATGTGRTLRLLPGHTEPVRAAVTSSDGRMAVSGGQDSTVRVWDLVTGALTHSLEGHAGSVNALALMPDGKMVLSAGSDGALRFWDLGSGELVRELGGHAGSVHAIALTTNGGTAVSASDDGTLRTWSVGSGETVRVLEGHSMPVRGVALTPDGRKAISASWDETVRLWDLESGEEIASYCARARMETVNAIRPDGSFACGTLDGHMHFVSLRNVHQDTPVVTGVRMFNYSLEGFGKRVTKVFRRVLRPAAQEDRARPAFEEGQEIGGNYTSSPVAKCLWCEALSPVPDGPAKAIRRNMGQLEAFMAPSLALSPEVFNDPVLEIACPACRKPLRLNPFLVVPSGAR